MNNVNSLLDLIQTKKNRMKQQNQPTRMCMPLNCFCCVLISLFYFVSMPIHQIVYQTACVITFFLAFMLFRPCVLFTSCVLPVIIFTGVYQFYTVQHMTSLLLKEMFKLAHDKKKMVLFVLHLISFWN